MRLIPMRAIAKGDGRKDGSLFRLPREVWDIESSEDIFASL